MAEFETKSDDQREQLAGGMVRSPAGDKQDWTLIRKGPLLKRWVALLSRGARVYGKNNWLKALLSTVKADRDKTKERFQESAARHFEQWINGDRDEDHAAAVIFNMNGYEAMLETDPPEQPVAPYYPRHEDLMPLEDPRKVIARDVAALDAELEAGFKISEYDPDADGGKYRGGR